VKPATGGNADMSELLNESAFQNLILSDDDVYQAMRDIPGYLDITPEDFRHIYTIACRKAFQRIMQSIRAKDIMTAKVVSVTYATPLEEVAHLMGHEGVSGLPVVDESRKVVGVISDKDFLRALGEGSARNFMAVIAKCLSNKGCLVMPIRAHKARDIMTSPATTVGENATVLEINTLFHEKKINRVPVVDSAAVLTGIVTRGDLLRMPSARMSK
jgi:CBS domain-containing protein